MAPGDSSTFCTRGPGEQAQDLLSRLLADMAGAWAQGQRPRAEDFLARYPALYDDPEAVADLIYEELCLCERHGERVDKAALLERFPRWRAQLAVLFDCQHLFEPVRTPRFPVVGERHGEYQLLGELGRGGGGVVYLATQPALADRPVVLKLTPCVGSEHLRLARLQHTHIVPLYSAHDDLQRGLRGLCMPYFGGTSLSRLLEMLEPEPPALRTGQDLLDALDRVQAKSPVQVAARGSARQILARASYAKAVCWIGSCLAGALHYAHEHGVVHLDLKPGNVLLTADGQPMLLDFHLARAPLEAGRTVAEGVGGTPDYMSPEQRAALTAVCAGQPIPTAVDARSDIYSLGVLLYRALGGRLPLGPEATRRLMRSNPGVSPGLADVLGKCLASEPAARYRDAAALAADLQRHLKDQPLEGVPNRSLGERWQKWRRRRPNALGLIVALVVMGATLPAGGLLYYQRQLADSRAALKDGQDRLKEQRYNEAAAILERGLQRAQQLPFHPDLERLREEQQRAIAARDAAKRATLAAALHALAEQARQLVSHDDVAPLARQSLETLCRGYWDQRADLLEALGPRDVAVQQDLLDLALLWTDLRVALAAPAEKTAARQEALQVLAEAEGQFGPSPVLYQRRERHAAAAGLTGIAQAAARARAALSPRSAGEHVALGRSFLAGGEFRQAIELFDRALRLQPENLWPHLYKGMCFDKLGDHADAIVSYSVCIGMAPQSAPCYYNRGLAYAGSGDDEHARGDFDRALELDPSLTAALHDRARLHLWQKRYPDARADLQRALAGGADPAAVHCDIAQVQLAQGDRTAALASLRTALQHDPAHAGSRELQRRLERKP